MAYHEPTRSDLPTDLELTVSKLRAGEIPVTVATNFEEAHPMTLLLKTDLEAETPKHFGRMQGYSGCLVSWSIQVGKERLARVLLLLDALFRTVEAAGCQVGVDKEAERSPPLFVQVGWGRVHVRLVERSNQPSPSRRSSSFRPMPMRIEFEIERSQPLGARKAWRDKIKEPLESHLCSIAARLLESGQVADAEARENYKQEQIRAAALQRQFELEERQREEDGRRRALEDMADLWGKCQRLQAFVAECEKRMQEGSDVDPSSDAVQWLAWAKQHAQRIDPLRGDFVARHRKHSQSPAYVYHNRWQASQSPPPQWFAD